MSTALTVAVLLPVALVVVLLVRAARRSRAARGPHGPASALAAPLPTATKFPMPPLASRAGEKYAGHAGSLPRGGAIGSATDPTHPDAPSRLYEALMTAPDREAVARRAWLGITPVDPGPGTARMYCVDKAAAILARAGITASPGDLAAIFTPAWFDDIRARCGAGAMVTVKNPVLQQAIEDAVAGIVETRDRETRRLHHGPWNDVPGIPRPA